MKFGKLEIETYNRYGESKVRSFGAEIWFYRTYVVLEATFYTWTIWIQWGKEDGKVS